jgi:iron complex transport system permease protein
MVFAVIAASFLVGLGWASLTGFDAPGPWVEAFLYTANAGSEDERRALILWEIRMPRFALGLCVGASLGLSGALMQTLFRNPMADPFILGVSPGAGLGAVASVVLGASASVSGLGATALGALAGGAGATMLVHALARRGSALPPGILLLTGLAVGGLATAAMTFLLLRLDASTMRAMLTWLLGSLANRGWHHVGLLAPFAIAGLALAWRLRHTLNRLAFGDESAYHLGVEIARARWWATGTASALAALAVAVSGTIGFVGLMAPHLARLILGPEHSRLLPGAALTGAILLATADLGSRCLLPNQELPVGIITSILGGAFLLALLRRSSAF